ncbi:hypothetical protein AB0B12_40745 [Streptomyces sp. NPDC044780]|uniref:hypothetical protein n=1 Tax=unclassified Streptomyces TaxID=2593676 RepID=UPI0034048C20
MAVPSNFDAQPKGSSRPAQLGSDRGGLHDGERRAQVANRKRRGSNGGRPPRFDRQAYRQRNAAERMINR